MKNKKIVSNIRLALFSGNAKLNTSLASVLGQNKVNLKEFCQKFDTYSSIKFEDKTLLKVTLTKFLDNSFEINKIKPLSIYVLYQLICKEDAEHGVCILPNFDTNHVIEVKLEKIFDFYQINKHLFVSLESTFSFLKSFANLKIKI